MAEEDEELGEVQRGWVQESNESYTGVADTCRVPSVQIGMLY